MNGRTARIAKYSLLAVLTAVGLLGCDLFTPKPDFEPINLSGKTWGRYPCFC